MKTQTMDGIIDYTLAWAGATLTVICSYGCVCVCVEGGGDLKRHSARILEQLETLGLRATCMLLMMVVVCMCG